MALRQNTPSGYSPLKNVHPLTALFTSVPSKSSFKSIAPLFILDKLGQKQGVNYSLEGRTGFGMLGICWIFWEIFWDFGDEEAQAF